MIRKVWYCLWQDLGWRREACEWKNVVECETQEEAAHQALAMEQEGELRVNTATLYPRYRDGYYRLDGEFVPTVFVYSSHGGLFGYFVTRWALDVDYSKVISGEKLKGYVVRGMHRIFELDSDKPLNHTYLNQHLERCPPPALTKGCS